MWKLSLAISTLVTSLAVLSPPAVAQDYPFCLRRSDEAGPGTCYYRSYRQCSAAASGINGYCYPNPRMAYGSYRRPMRYAPGPGIPGNPYPSGGIPGNPYAGGGPSGANQATNRPNASNEIGSGR
ncbi:hypothetical protein V1291_004409 [Nitrobacteraceae bacterium AZCC 1564]